MSFDLLVKVACEAANETFVMERVHFSEHKLLFDNDIRNENLANIGRPRVWSQTRQELCESVPYFRNWQSGVYFKEGVTYGYLVDGYGAMRDPEYELDNNDDDLTDEEDILNGNNTEHKPKTMHEGPFIRWKFRFEWVPDQEYPPWWESPSQKLIYSTLLPGALRVFICPECEAPSSKIYKTAWICLNHKCNRFWQAWSDKNQWIKVPNNLIYDPVFLNPGLISRDQLHRIPFSILPPQPPGTSNNDITNSSVLYGVQYWKGFHCLRCGRVSCRDRWAFWECANCGLKHEAPEQRLFPSMLRNPNLPVLIGPAFDYDSCIKDNSGITKTSEVSAEGAVVRKYYFPEGGYIIHRIGNNSINRISDQFFMKFQRKDLPFKRNTLKKGCNRS
ncbi:4031_t:CDS:2, partial [Scutellospora calospora]